MDTLATEKYNVLSTNLRILQDVLQRLSALRIDATEYACLKALVLFKSGMLFLHNLNLTY